MSKYKILSDNFSLASQGDTVDSEVLDGCNIAALIEAGHIVEIGDKVSKKSVSEETEK